GLGLKPLVDSFRRRESLVNVSSLVNQVKHYLIFNRFVELVCVDVFTKYFKAGSPVVLQKGSSSKADEYCVGQQRFHCFVELAGLSTMTFIYEHEQLTNSWRRTRPQFFYECVEIIDTTLTELVNQ